MFISGSIPQVSRYPGIIPRTSYRQERFHILRRMSILSAFQEECSSGYWLGGSPQRYFGLPLQTSRGLSIDSPSPTVRSSAELSDWSLGLPQGIKLYMNRGSILADF